jgi:hypothetical protein
MIAFLPLVSGSADCQQPWAGILSPSRAGDWSTAGVAGGIPSANWPQCRTSACKTVVTGPASSISVAQINAAIVSAPPNTYVYLPAGTYDLASGLLVNDHSNVEIRGAGANATLLDFTKANGCQGAWATICFQSPDMNYSQKISNGPVSWTAGYSQGSTSITLAKVPNLKVGNTIILDQEDDACTSGCPGTTDTGTVFVCSDKHLPVPCSLQGNGGGARLFRGQEQIVTVTSISGRGPYTVGISPGLYMPNWSQTKDPQAWWATHPVKNVGVQDLTINLAHAGSRPGNGIGIEFFNALNGWVQGVRSEYSSRSVVQAFYSARITVSDSYFYLTQFSTSTSYGFECFSGSDNLIENNIFQGLAGAVTINGACSGTVVGYNYDLNNYYTSSAGWVMPMSNLHAPGTDHILYEGNVGVGIAADVFHGSHNLVTIFRNYLPGNEPACWRSGKSYAETTWGRCSGDPIPIALGPFSRFFNIVGNVLGEVNIQKKYEAPHGAIYGIGYPDGLAGGNDPLVATTLMRWGNYDTVNSAVRWDATEVPSKMAGALAPYDNPVPKSQRLPASFYYASKPPWWPRGKAWPPIGPDVSGGNVAGVSGHVFTIPAEDCYLNVMRGPLDGTGSVGSFDAAACYASRTSARGPSVVIR